LGQALLSIFSTEKEEKAFSIVENVFWKKKYFLSYLLKNPRGEAVFVKLWLFITFRVEFPERGMLPKGSFLMGPIGSILKISRLK